MAKRVLGILTLLLFVAVIASGQSVPPPPPPPPPAPPSIPIDGGVIGLLLAGVAYGARKLYSKEAAE